MKAVYIYVAVWATLSLSISAITDSVLDITENCGVSLIEENICISSDNPQINKKKSARTDVECAMSCKTLYDCSSVYRDTDGNCYTFSDAEVDQVDPIVGFSTGKQITFYEPGDVSDCGGNPCSGEEVCFKGCRSEQLSTPVCVADDRGNCSLKQEYTNARHYWTPVTSDGADSATVMTVTYPKKRSTTGLRVILHMNVRGHYNNPGYCHHWYLTFDDQKCTNPETIEQLDFSATTGDYHRAMDIDGTCYGLDQGSRVIKLVIAPCDGYGSTDGHSGWNSPRSMIIMEVIPQDYEVDVPSYCPHSSVFNYQYNSWNELFDTEFNTSAGPNLVKSIPYTKLASDTSLRIKYNALLSVKITTNGLTYCGRWFVAINGTECSPTADIIISHNNSNAYSYWRDHTRVYTLEGICENQLEAGTYDIQIYMGQCDMTSDSEEMTHFVANAFNSPSRLHVEEVRMDQQVDGVYTKDHSVFKSLTGQISRYNPTTLDYDLNDGYLYTVTYTKQFADTGLRLTSSGTHANTLIGGYAYCARWYFLIDDVACTNPGVIEGVSHFNYETWSYQPMQVSGVCHGLAAGDRRVTYAVGLCSGYTTPDALTGFGASFHIFVEELRVDLVKTCDSNPVQCYGP